MMKRKTVSVAIDTKSLIDYEVDSQYALNRLDARIAQMDDHRSLLLLEKNNVLITHAEKILALIRRANITCSKYTTDREKLSCTDAKTNACENIKEGFVPKITKYNALVATYMNDADYTQFTAHDKTDLETLSAADIIEQANLDAIGCVLTTSPERSIHQENVLLSQETRTKGLIKVEEENKASKRQSQAIANDKENLETHKQGLYVAKTGEKDSIIITKISQIDKSTIVDTVLEQCENIIHNFNPLEGDTIDISQCGKYKVSQISFRTFTTDKTATGQIPISGVKVDGKEGYIACVYGFDADKFFDPYYVDPDTRVPHMLEIYDVITLTQPQGIYDEL